MNDWLDKLDRLEQEAMAGPWKIYQTREYAPWVVFDPTTASKVGETWQRKDADFWTLLRNHARELIDAVRDAEKLRYDIIDVLSTMDTWAAKANLNGLHRDCAIIRDLRNELAKVLKDD